MRVAWIAHAAECELRIPPHEFAVVQLRVQRNSGAGIRWNFQAEVHRIRRTGRDQMNVNGRARGPGIALVDLISVGIDQNRMVKMRAGLDRTASAIFRHAAPENHTAIFVRRGKFQPAIERVDRSTGEKMPDLPRSNHDVHARRVAAPHGSRNAIERASDRSRRHR